MLGRLSTLLISTILYCVLMNRTFFWHKLQSILLVSSMLLRILVIIILMLKCCTGIASVHQFAGKDEIHDEEHIKLHLKNKVDIGNLSETQQRFHYFSMNDLDKDNKLDGIEITKTLWHTHEDQESPILTDEQISEMVDPVLLDMDMNGDGYISYSEYVMKTTRK